MTNPNTTAPAESSDTWICSNGRTHAKGTMCTTAQCARELESEHAAPAEPKVAEQFSKFTEGEPQMGTESMSRESLQNSNDNERFQSNPRHGDDPSVTPVHMRPKPASGLRTGETPLTYQQEVHALLYKGITFGEDLIRYFEAQAKQESGDLKRLTEKCIVNTRHDVERFRALIPEALKRRAALASAPASRPLPPESEDTERGKL